MAGYPGAFPDSASSANFSAADAVIEIDSADSFESVALTGPGAWPVTPVPPPPRSLAGLAAGPSGKRSSPSESDGEWSDSQDSSDDGRGSAVMISQPARHRWQRRPGNPKRLGARRSSLKEAGPWYNDDDNDSDTASQMVDSLGAYKDVGNTSEATTERSDTGAQSYDMTDVGAGEAVKMYSESSADATPTVRTLTYDKGDGGSHTSDSDSGYGGSQYGDYGEGDATAASQAHTGPEETHDGSTSRHGSSGSGGTVVWHGHPVVSSDAPHSYSPPISPSAVGLPPSPNTTNPDVAVNGSYGGAPSPSGSNPNTGGHTGYASSSPSSTDVSNRHHFDSIDMTAQSDVEEGLHVRSTTPADTHVFGDVDMTCQSNAEEGRYDISHTSTDPHYFKDVDITSSDTADADKVMSTEGADNTSGYAIRYEPRSYAVKLSDCHRLLGTTCGRSHSSHAEDMTIDDMFRFGPPSLDLALGMTGTMRASGFGEARNIETRSYAVKLDGFRNVPPTDIPTTGTGSTDGDVGDRVIASDASLGYDDIASTAHGIAIAPPPAFTRRRRHPARLTSVSDWTCAPTFSAASPAPSPVPTGYSINLELKLGSPIEPMTGSPVRAYTDHLDALSQRASIRQGGWLRSVRQSFSDLVYRSRTQQSSYTWSSSSSISVHTLNSVQSRSSHESRSEYDLPSARSGRSSEVSTASGGLFGHWKGRIKNKIQASLQGHSDKRGARSTARLVRDLGRGLGKD